MQCSILRNFTFSRDGITAERVESGSVADIPGNLVAGLEAEGYLRREVKGPSRENKMLAPAEENKRRRRTR